MYKVSHCKSAQGLYHPLYIHFGSSHLCPSLLDQQAVAVSRLQLLQASMAVAGPMALMLVTIDDNVPFTTGCDQEFEDLHGRAACFPAISVWCCNVHLSRERLMRVCDASIGGCLVCRQDVQLRTDGLGKAIIYR